MALVVVSAGREQTEFLLREQLQLEPSTKYNSKQSMEADRKRQRKRKDYTKEKLTYHRKAEIMRLKRKNIDRGIQYLKAQELFLSVQDNNEDFEFDPENLVYLYITIRRPTNMYKDLMVQLVIRQENETKLNNFQKPKSKINKNLVEMFQISYNKLVLCYKGEQIQDTEIVDDLAKSLNDFLESLGSKNLVFVGNGIDKIGKILHAAGLLQKFVHKSRGFEFGKFLKKELDCKDMKSALNLCMSENEINNLDLLDAEVECTQMEILCDEYMDETMLQKYEIALFTGCVQKCIMFIELIFV